MKNQPVIEACRNFRFRNTPETLRYFYHPDHIGSTSWVTDNAKNGIQYCEYLPFGEPFIDQRSTTWNSRYTFSGKERDNETGYSYFGARYHNSDISIWLSVDPMADKYPNLTSYAYCANNPIVLVDPDGKFPYPTKGTILYTFKANIGVGIMYALGVGFRSGIAADKYGMTHFTGTYVMHGNNQNIYESSPNPAFIVGVGGGASVGYEYNKSDNFVNYLRTSSANVNFGIKGIVGGSVGGGDDSYCGSIGVGLEIGLNGEQFKIKESISLTQKQVSKAGAYSFWTVKQQQLKFDKEGKPFFEGQVYSENLLWGGPEAQNITVTSQAIKTKDGKYVSSGVWLSNEYKKAIEN